MSRKPLNFLRRYRKRHGLTQREVSFLMGWKRSDQVSEHERRVYQPCLRTAFKYQVMYGVSAHELFPQIYEEVEQELQNRAHLLSEQFDEDTSSLKRETKKNLIKTIMFGRVGGIAQAV